MIGSPSIVRRALTGVGPMGIAVIVALCALNALRRAMGGMFPTYPVLPTFTIYFVQGLTQAALLFVAVVIAVNLVPLRGWRRVALVGTAIVTASGFGSASLLLWSRPPEDFLTCLYLALAGCLRWSTLAAMMTGAWLFLRAEEQNRAALQRAELARIGLDRQMTEARLQVLQAQIEPHFLFNTLAHIRLLYQTDPALATGMLDNLMRYLAIALPRMREVDSTLGREIDLVEAYLGVQQIRMGRRLAFKIDVDDSLRALPVPAMMLLTLAENAIKHGVSPLPEGGSITIAAALHSDRLTLEVADTGRGFEPNAGAGTGTGLANVRARLAALYGTDAMLSLMPNQPRGLRIRFGVPQRRPEPSLQSITS